MTQPTKAALEEAKALIQKWIEDNRSFSPYECPELIKELSDALAAAEERGRKAGEERIESLIYHLSACYCFCQFENPMTNQLLTYPIKCAKCVGIKIDRALAAKEKNE